MTSLLSPSGLYDQFKKLLGAYEEEIEENEKLKLKNKELNDKLRELIGEQKVPKFKAKKKDKKDLHHPKPSTRNRKKKTGKKKAKTIRLKLIEKKNFQQIRMNFPRTLSSKGPECRARWRAPQHQNMCSWK